MNDSVIKVAYCPPIIRLNYMLNMSLILYEALYKTN